MRRFSPKEQRTLAALGLMAVINLVAYSHFLKYLLRRTTDLGQQLRQTREQVRSLKMVTGNSGSLEQEFQRLNVDVQGSLGTLPPEEELPATIELLSDLASQASMTIQAIFPQRPGLGGGPEGRAAPLVEASPPSHSAFKAVPIQLDAISGYHELGTFLSLIESANRPIGVASLRISSQPKDPTRHLIKLVIEAYVVPQDVITPAAKAR